MRFAPLVVLLMAWCCTSNPPVLDHQRLLVSLRPDRSQTFQQVKTYCGAGTDRNSLVPVSGRTAAKMYSQGMQNLDTPNGLNVLKLAKEGNWIQLVGELESDSTLKWRVVGVLIVAVLAVMAVFVFGCCWKWPLRCDSCFEKGARMVTPIAISVLFAVLFMGSALTGFTTISKFPQAVRSFKCSVALTVDDVVNGNETTDGNSYFFGTQRLPQIVGHLSKELNKFTETLLKDTAPRSIYLVQLVDKSLRMLEMLGNPSVANSSFELNYTDPVPGSHPGRVVPSRLGRDLGNPTLPDSLCGAMYQNLRKLSTALWNLKRSLRKVQLFGGDLQKSMGTFSKQMKKIDGTVKQLRSDLLDLQQELDSRANFISRALWAPYMTSVLVVILLFVAQGYLLKEARYNHSNNIEAKKISLAAYLTLTFVFVLSVTFLLIYLCMASAFHISCSTISHMLTNNTAFTQAASELNIPAEISTVTADCLVGGFGMDPVRWFVMVTEIGRSRDELKNFNRETFDAAAKSLTDTIGRYYTAKDNDLKDDPQSMTFFRQLANRSRPSCWGSPVFQKDSLVPSLSNMSLSLVPCAEGALPINCSDFAKCLAGCVSLSDIMLSSNSTESFQKKVRLRYAATPNCASELSEELAWVYGNWHFKRIDNRTGIGRVSNDWSSINATLSKIRRLLEQLPLGQMKFDIIRNSIGTYEVVSKSKTMESGGAGLSCQIMNEDLLRVHDTFCVNVWKAVYEAMMCLASLSVFLLGALSCLVIAVAENIQAHVPESCVAETQNNDTNELIL